MSSRDEVTFGDSLDEKRPLVMLNLLKFHDKAKYSPDLNIECSGYD